MGYPGAKNNSGIQQWLINRIPPHRVYVEAFAGSAALFSAKRSAAQSILIEKDPKQAAWLHSQFPLCDIRCRSAQTELPMLAGTDVFIYADPPYPFSSRRSQKPLYRQEMTDAEHVEFLQLAIASPGFWMISTRQNELYSSMLSGWRKETFDCHNHVGPVQEIIYMNYPPPAFLHQYDHLGNGFIDRQRIKRKIDRFAGKMEALPDTERHALILEYLKRHPQEAETLLKL